MPFNQAKPSEFGDGPPAAGQTVDPPDPMVSGSTLTETNASPKAGKGNPQMSFNPTNGPLDRVRVDSGGRTLCGATPGFFVDRKIQDVSFGNQGLFDATEAALKRR